MLVPSRRWVSVELALAPAPGDMAALTAHPACSQSPKGHRTEGLASGIAKSTDENRFLPENCWEQERPSI